MNTFARLALVLALILVPSACGGAADAPPGPADVARDFMSAARDGDVAGLEALLTAKALAGAKGGGDGGGFQLGEQVGAFEIGAARVEGDEARVPVQATSDGQEQDVTLCMRREGDAWRIWGFEMVLGDEAAMTIDLESFGSVMEQMASELSGAFQQAFEDAARGGSDEELRAAHARFDAIAPIDAARYENAWKIDLDADGRAASDVIEELLAGTELAFERDAALEQPLTLALRGVSRIEAIERVCAELGVHAVYPDFGGELAFERGPRPRPVALAGPFLVEVAELEENAPHATGTASLAVRALGLAPEVLGFQTEVVEMLVLERATDARGNGVRADEDVRWMSTPGVEGGYLSDRTSIDLRGLVRSVDSISFEGSVRIEIPTSVRSARWEYGATAPKDVGGLTLSVREWGDSQSFEITGADDFESFQVRVAASDAAGEPIGIPFTSTSSWSGKLNVNVQTADVPRAIELRICAVAEVVAPFALRDVPLARASEQPERIEPLSFDGDAPLAVDFVRVVERGDFAKIELRVRSAANKDALEAQVTFVYLDARGSEIGSFAHTLSGPFSYDGFAPLVAGGATATQETTAFFMPAETASVRVRVDEASFIDASTWSRGE